MCVIVVAGAIKIVDSMSAKSYEGATTIFVRQMLVAPDAKSEDYKFDGYYAVMANQTFADTLENWIKSPEIVAEAYQNQKMDYPKSMSSLSNRYEIDKVISQSVAIRVTSGNTEESEKLLKGMIAVLREKIEKYLIDQSGKPIFTIDNSPVLVLEHQADYRVQYGIGVLGALCLGLFLIYFIDALREKKE